MRNDRICKFCGNEIENTVRDGTENCYNCVKHCMNQCEIASNPNTSWHKEPCIKCMNNPYKMLWKWDGEKWERK